MMSAVLRGALCAPLFVVAAAWPAAAADTVERSELEACARLAAADRRLACFEALTVRGDEPGETAPRGNAPQEKLPPPAPALPQEPGPLPAAGASRPPIAARDPALQQPREQRQEEPREQRDEPRVAPLDARAGREHLPDTGPAPEVLLATVTEVTREHNRLLYFHMANGQVWRQMESGYIRYPREGAFDVEIRQGIMGDYRLRVEGKGRMTRIVRVR